MCVRESFLFDDTSYLRLAACCALVSCFASFLGNGPEEYDPYYHYHRYHSPDQLVVVIFKNGHTRN